MGTAAVANSGSAQGSAISLDSRGNSSSVHTVLIENNKLYQYNNYGVLMTLGETNSASRLNATIRNNSISNAGTNAVGFAMNGVHLNSGTTSSSADQVCLALGGSGAANAINGSSANSGTDFRLRQRQSTTVRLPGYTGASNDIAAVVAFVQSNNGGTPTGSAAVGTSGGGFTNTSGPAGAACALPLLAAGGEGPGAESLTQAALSSVAAKAIARWSASGIQADDRAKLESVSFSLANLQPGQLGGASATAVQIDRNAAGWGWYVDPTPAGNSEFVAAGGELRAIPGGLAEGRIDLLTVVMHELGHVLGYGDLSVSGHPHNLMAENIPTGVRRVPGGLAGLSVRASVAPQAASFPLNISTLPAGKRITITFDVVIANPLPSGVTQVSNQGRVSGSNFGPVLTDDPATTVRGDPTITPLDIVTTFHSYLPLVTQASTVVAAPDLVVTGISLVPNKLTFRAGEQVEVRVTVKNRGSAAAELFWLDLYINPSSPPTAANQIWNTRCGLTPCFGMAWEVASGLAPEQSITLSSLSLPAGYSIWPGYFASGTSDIYAYADSYKPGVASGAVAESNETNNRAEIDGLSVTGPNPALVKLQSAKDLRLRPAHRTQ